MAASHSTTHPAFLIFPATSPVFTWRVVALETNRTISRHKNLELAIEKAERLNVLATMPAPQYATRESYLARDIRKSCQAWYDYADGDGRECSRPASVSDRDSGCSFCVNCWMAQ